MDKGVLSPLPLLFWNNLTSTKKAPCLQALPMHVCSFSGVPHTFPHLRINPYGIFPPLKALGLKQKKKKLSAMSIQHASCLQPCRFQHTCPAPNHHSIFSPGLQTCAAPRGLTQLPQQGKCHQPLSHCPRRLAHSSTLAASKPMRAPCFGELEKPSDRKPASFLRTIKWSLSPAPSHPTHRGRSFGHFPGLC